MFNIIAKSVGGRKDTTVTSPYKYMNRQLGIYWLNSYLQT